MEARELRVGNYVELEGVYSKLNNTTFKAIIEGRYNDLKHIPLTEEILLKCGFYVSKYSDTLFILELTEWSSIQVHLYKNKCATELSISKHSQEVEVYFLHQLQNLYWCLTNEELNINL